MPSCSDLGDWNATNVCKCPLSLWLRSSAINKERRIFAQFIAFSQAVVKKAYGYWKDFLVRVPPRRGPHIASHSVCLSVCLSVRPVIYRYRASRGAT